MLRSAWVSALPSDGNYILMLGPAGTFSPPITVSGVQVREQQGWMRDRPRLPPADAGRRTGPLFSIITTVFDTEPGMLQDTVGSVLSQQFAEFEWLVLDNGSRAPATVAAVAALGECDRRIRTFRVEENIHIIRGNRYLLKRARGEYILPIDADDLLYPEALAWLERAINTHLGTAVVFGDEEKVDALGEPIAPIHRESWTRIAAMGTVPAAHPMAYRRDLAVAYDVYSDERTLGSHDWDTALRFADHGHGGLHVPAILYGWRVHAASTSLSGSAKGYVEDSQRNVIAACLARRGLSDLFEIRRDQRMIGMYHLARLPLRPQPVQLVLLIRDASGQSARNAIHTLASTDYPLAGTIAIGPREGLRGPTRDALVEAALAKGIPAPSFRETTSISSLEAIRGLAEICRAGTHVAIVDAAMHVTDSAWIWDAMGALELDDAVGIVGGYVYSPGGEVMHYGLVKGLADGVATPLYGRLPEDRHSVYSVRYRAVSGVHCGFMLVRDTLVRDIGLPSSADWDAVSCDASWTFAALQRGALAAMGPRMRAVRQRPFASQGKVETPRFHGRFPELPDLDPYYGWYLSRRSQSWGDVSRDVPQPDQ